MPVQLQNWRGRAREAIGLSATVGLAAGGAAATAAGATLAVAQGIVQGAANASRSMPAAISGQPSVQAEAVKVSPTMRCAQSAENLQAVPVENIMCNVCACGVRG